LPWLKAGGPDQHVAGNQQEHAEDDDSGEVLQKREKLEVKVCNPIHRIGSPRAVPQVDRYCFVTLYRQRTEAGAQRGGKRHRVATYRGGANGGQALQPG
jgi:hypothetical protein